MLTMKPRPFGGTAAGLRASNRRRRSSSIDILMPLFGRHLGYFTEGALSGVIDQNVQSTKSYPLPEKLAYFVGAADVGGKPYDLPSGVISSTPYRRTPACDADRHRDSSRNKCFTIARRFRVYRR